ncbi:MAG: WD40 repeat domain-containing protein [Candidatus Poribacteria bacterium]|nr:WD40 repeat domain-containing protein [Candidatus Poribacteria bacterium]
MQKTAVLILMIAFSLCVMSQNTDAQDWHLRGLPEGAIARLGKGAINKVAYAPDGTRLAVGSSIGVWIYDVETSTALDLFPMSGVSCLAFSPDGKTLVSGSNRHNLVLWDMATGEPLRTFNNVYGSDVFSVAFSPDGKTLVSGHDNGFICLWETATGKASNYFFNIWGEEGTVLVPKHIDAIRGLAYSPDGKILVSICDGDSDAVHLWEATTGKYIQLLYSVEGEMDSVESIAFSPDGRTLAIGSGTGGIDLWNMTETEALPQYLDGYHRWEVLSLAFSQDGALLASCGRDSTVRLWDMETNKHLRTFIGHKDDVFSVAFSPDGKTLASSSKEAVRLWNTEGEEHLRFVITHTAILDVAFSPDGKTLASGHEDNTVGLWDAKTGKSLNTLIGHKGEVSNVAFSPDGKTLASSGNEDKTVRLWDTKTGIPLIAPIGHKGIVRSVVFSPDGKTFATEFLVGIVYFRDTKTSELRHTFTKPKHWVGPVMFNPDGQVLALVQDEDRNRSLWDIKADELICTFIVPTTKRSLWGVAFSPDGSMLATGMVDKTPLGKRDDIVWLWDTTTGEHIRTLTGHLGNITCVAFSPDGQLLASGSEDETVFLWPISLKAKTGKHPHILIGHNDEVLDAAFSPDGKTLASRSKDGIVLLWNVP